MTTLKVFMFLAAMLAVAFAAPGFFGKHEHHTIHVPYKVHTIHHHHIKNVPIYKPIYKEVIREVPVVKEVHVPVVKEVHVPVYKEVHVPVHVNKGWEPSGSW